MPSPPGPLRDAEAHAERLFALSQDLLGAADAAGRLRWVNAAWERTMGWSARGALLASVSGLRPPGRPREGGRVRRAARRLPPGESLQVETRALPARPATYRWLRVSAAVAGGAEPMVYLSGTDVTDLHEALPTWRAPTTSSTASPRSSPTTCASR